MPTSNEILGFLIFVVVYFSITRYFSSTNNAGKQTIIAAISYLAVYVIFKITSE
jgi:hypothetical protein